MDTFLGYRRENGTIGIRNLVALIATCDRYVSLAHATAAAVRGCVPLEAFFTAGQVGKDLAITARALAGLGRNPNVAAVLLLGPDTPLTEEVANAIRDSGKPIRVDHGTGGYIEALARATLVALELAAAASHERRSPAPMSSLRVGLECGGSDTTSGLTCNPAIGAVSDLLIAQGAQVIISETSEFIGAEHLFAARATEPEVARRFMQSVLDVEAMAMARGVNLRDEQPSADNKRGGLSTVEEKSLGAMCKAGSSPLIGVLGYAQAPKQPGLYFMDAPAPAVENLTGMAAAGCQLLLFGTGVGNPIGNPVAPTVKICGNRRTIKSMFDNMDYDVSAILDEGQRPAEVGEGLYHFTLRVASGRLVSCEVLRFEEAAISRFLPSL